MYIQMYDPISGEIGSVKLEDLENALLDNYQPVNKDQTIPMISKDGENGDVEVINIIEAMKDGYNFSYKGDDWLPFIGKSLLKGTLSIAELPRMAVQITEGLGNLVSDLTGEDYLKTDLSSSIPSPTTIRDELDKNYNIDLEPHPASETQRRVGNVLEFGAALPTAGLWGNLAKTRGLTQKLLGTTKSLREAGNQAVLGGTIGGIADSLHRDVGLHPIAADVAGIVAAPFLTKAALKGFQTARDTGKRLGERFSVNENTPYVATDPLSEVAQRNSIVNDLEQLKGEVSNIPTENYIPENLTGMTQTPLNDQHLQYKIAKELRKHIPLEDTAKVINNIEQGLPIINPDTVTVAQHPGFYSLNRAIGADNLAMLKREAANNQLLRDELGRFGDLNANLETSGNQITESLFSNFSKLKQERYLNTDPLLEELKGYREPVIIEDLIATLKNESKYEKGDIKAGYDKSMELLESNVTPGKPIPYELRSTIKAINAEMKKTTTSNEALVGFNKAKELIEQRALESPGGLDYQRGYAESSGPITEQFGTIEKPNLAGKIIEKDRLTGKSIIPMEKIGDKILSSSTSLEDKRILLNQLKGYPEGLQAVKDVVVNKFLKNIEQGSLDAQGNYRISDIKADKWLKEHDTIISNLFNPNELKTFEDIANVINKRQMVKSVASTQGSPTYANQSLGENIGKNIIDNIPGVKKVKSLFAPFQEKEQMLIRENLRKALDEPNYAKTLLQVPIEQSILKDYYNRPQVFKDKVKKDNGSKKRKIPQINNKNNDIEYVEIDD